MGMTNRHRELKKKCIYSRDLGFSSGVDADSMFSIIMSYEGHVYIKLILNIFYKLLKLTSYLIVKLIFCSKMSDETFSECP